MYTYVFMIMINNSEERSYTPPPPPPRGGWCTEAFISILAPSSIISISHSTPLVPSKVCAKNNYKVPQKCSVIICTEAFISILAHSTPLVPRKVCAFAADLGADRIYPTT